MSMKKSTSLICIALLALTQLAVAADEDKPGSAELEKRLAEARRELNEAAREVARLSQELGQAHAFRFIAGEAPAPRAGLGLMIRAGEGKAEGVEVVGVTPGGPAEQAGLRSGDLLLAIDGKELAMERGEAAVQRLTEHLREVEPGTVVTLRYRRDGKTAEASVKTEVFSPGAFFGPRPLPPLAPLAPGPEHFAFLRHFSDALGDMELVSLSPELGEYFGTDSGVLVVRAPDNNEAWKLRDGDVILKIGDRVPASPVHAMRILRSYRPGEKLRLEIMREKRRQTLDIELPEAEPAAWRLEPDAIRERIELRLTAPAQPL